MDIDFEKAGGLVPAVAQDVATGQVLMLAWMNREAYEETLRTGRAVYYSRSRGKLWRKGEESGHVQEVRGVFVDCDADTVLLLGDYLYAQGLVRLSAAGSVEAVADMGELISLCAKLRAEESGDDGPAWAATVALLGKGVLAETTDSLALLARAQRATDPTSVERALAAHRRRVG